MKPYNKNIIGKLSDVPCLVLEEYVILVKYFIHFEKPDNAKTKFGARFDNYKSAHSSYRKKKTYHSNVFMDIMANTVIMGLKMDSSH